MHQDIIEKSKLIHEATYTSSGGRVVELKVWACVVKPTHLRGEKRQGTRVKMKIDSNPPLYGLSILNPNDLYDEDKGIKEAIRQCNITSEFNKTVSKDIWEATLQNILFRDAAKAVVLASLYEQRYGIGSLYKHAQETEFTFHGS